MFVCKWKGDVGVGCCHYDRFIWRLCQTHSDACQVHFLHPHLLHRRLNLRSHWHEDAMTNMYQSMLLWTSCSGMSISRHYCTIKVWAYYVPVPLTMWLSMWIDEILSVPHVAISVGLRRERAKALCCGAPSLKHSHKIHSHESGQGAEQKEGGLGGSQAYSHCQLKSLV